MTTFAEQYNEQVLKLMPHFESDLLVPSEIDSENEIDEIVFQRSEYLGGMANVICAVVHRENTINTLKSLIYNNKLDPFTVVVMARKDIEGGNFESAISRLQVDADKIRMISPSLYNLLK